MVDKETKEILEEQREIQSLTGQAGWRIIHAKFVDRIAELRDAFELDDQDAQKMFIDLQARKVAAHILKSFLEDIEGTVPQIQESDEEHASHILRIN